MTLNEWLLSLPKEEQAMLAEDKWMLANRAWEAALKSKPDAVAKLACSDGLSCPLLDECDAVSEAIGDKQILASALREIYNIRGEDKDIDRIVNEALHEACAT